VKTPGVDVSLSLAETEAALRQGVRFGERRLRLCDVARNDGVVLEVYGPDQLPNGVLIPLSPQHVRLLVLFVRARMRAALAPGAPAWVSLSRLLHAAGELDEKKLLTGDEFAAETRKVDFPNYLRSPLRQLRHALRPYGLYVSPLGVDGGRAGGYQLMFLEEFRFAPESPDPWEVDDDAALPCRPAR